MIHRKDIIIKPADKNVGITVTEKTVYNNFVTDHLKDKTTYKKLENNPLEATRIKIKALLFSLLKKKLINTRIHNALIPKSQTKPGYFYALFKLHKEKLSIRPIISQINHPTRNLSKFLHFHLLNTAKSAPSYLNNSYELKNILDTIIINKDTVLITCDIKSLYTNINTKEGIIHTLNSYYRFNKLNNKKLHPFLLKTLLYNTLSLNIFEYNNSYFQQINGTAMGTIMAPTYANCFLSDLEKDLHSNNNIIIFKRYIDDIFIIYNNINRDLEDFFEILHKTYSNLELTIEHSVKSIIFLDLEIILNQISNKIETKLHKKPIGNTDLIHKNSSHPYHMISNIISNESLRALRLNSNNLEYRKQQIQLIAKALKRNYSLKTIKSAINKNSNKEKSKEKSNVKKFLICTYNNFMKNNVKDIKQSLSQVTENFRISFKLNNSLKDLLCSRKRIENALNTLN